MTGARPEVHWESLPGALEAGLAWRQHFTGGPVKEAASAWMVAAETDWVEASKQVLLAAGIEDADEATLKSTHNETLGQILTGIAQDMSGRVGHEVACTGGEESSERAGNAEWARFHIQFATGGVAVDFLAGLEQELLESLVTHDEAAPAAAAPSATGTPMPAGSKTFELLLDVELPVSVSFGRAQVPLKDVLKLTTGSIVELNRSIAEPVEVIVNNCVIARGVVVVVEGNFGVRIQEVISRQERLRTLN